MKNKIKCLLILNIIFVLINLTVFAATSDLVDDEYFMLSMEDLYGSRYTMPQVGDNTENVNKNDGAFEVREMDIVIEGQNGFNLPVIRCFNSDASTGSLDGRDLNNASVQKTGVAYPYSYEIDGVEKIRYVGFYDLDEAANAPYSFMGRNVSNDSYSETYSDETNPQSGYFYKMYSVLTNEAYTLNTEYTLVENAQKRWIYDKVSMYYRNPDNVAETSVNLKNGWTISVPTISVDQYELTNVARKSRGVFRDIYGNAYPYFAYTTEYNDNQAINFGFKTLQQDYYEEFVNEDNVRETLTFNGKAYNLKIIGKDGITYYFNHTFLSNTNGKFIGMSDRYGNKITYAKSTSSADGITYHTYTDSYNNKIKISQNGVLYNGKELIRYTQAIENDSSEEIDEGNNEYIFKVYKKEGDEDILSSENVTEYYSKRRPSLSGLPRILSYDMFLPHKVVYPSGAESYYEYDYYDNYRYYTNSIGPEIIKKFYVNKSYDKDINGNIKNSYEYTFSFANRELATAKYTNTVTDTINNSTKSLQFNRVGQLINETKKKNSNNFICEIIDYEYDAEKIGGKVTSINTRERTSSTKYADNLTTYTYDTNYNMTKEENGDYCVNYTYDTDYYNLPLTKSYKQDADTEILVVNTLSEDHKSIVCEKTYVNSEAKQAQHYTYDTYGNITKIETVTGCNCDDNTATPNVQVLRTIEYSYTFPTSSDNHKTITTTVKNLYDADSVLLDDVVTTKKYDYLGNIVSSTDALGNTTTFEYDNLGRTIKTTYPDNAYETVDYDTQNNIIITTDALGNKMKYVFDEWGNQTASYGFKDNSFYILESWTYDAKNRLATHIQHRTAGNITETYTYDYRSRLTSKTITNANGETESKYTYSYTYGNDSNGRGTFAIVVNTPQNNDVTPAQIVKKYDYRNNLIMDRLYVDSDNLITKTATYDYVGNMITSKDGRGYTTRYEYDYQNNLTKTILPISGYETTNTYDVLGNCISSTDAMGTTTTYTYDILNRLIKAETPLNENENMLTKTYYDKNGNTIKTMIKSGDNSFDTTEYAYDTRNRLKYVKTNPTPQTSDYTRYFYDLNGNVTSYITGLSDPENIPLDCTSVDYTYNNLNLLEEENRPYSEPMFYEYDNAGNVSYIYTPNGDEYSMTYNSNNSILSRVGEDIDEEYRYDYWGNVVYAQNDYGTTTYTYDVFGRLTSETNNGIMKAYTYNKNNDVLTFKIYENDELIHSESNSYDALGRVTTSTINGKTATYTYDKNGNVTTYSFDGNDYTYTYNKANMPTGKTSTLGQKTFGAQYLPNGNISILTETGAPNISYTYDGAGRLTNETKTGVSSVTYGYDARGNRTSKVYNDLVNNTSETTTYEYPTYNNNLDTIKVNGVASEHFGYDNNGNLMRKFNGNYQITDNYTYDVLNRLTQTTSNGVTTSYTYDTNNLRQTKTTGNETVRHIYNGQNVVMDKFANGVTHSYVKNAAGEMSAVKICDPTNTETPEYYDYYITNLHNDVVGTSNGKTYSYDAFGNQQNANATDNNPFRYTGEYYDHETDLIYLRNRYYDPSIGRFITEDPARDGLNWYVYCGNNPIMFVDPSGNIREPGYVNGVWCENPDAYEFGKKSDTYKILVDLGNRWNSGTSKQKEEYSALAEKVRRLAREGTPIQYAQDRIINQIHKNANAATDYQVTMTTGFSGFMYQLGGGNYLADSSSFLIGMAYGDWNYKYDSNWQVPYDYFDGNDMNVDNNKNWRPWMYFDGMLVSADKFGNINMAYVGVKMNLPYSVFQNFATTDKDDAFWVQYGINMAEQGR